LEGDNGDALASQAGDEEVDVRGAGERLIALQVHHDSMLYRLPAAGGAMCQQCRVNAIGASWTSLVCRCTADD
jgi:hypothetical protein